MCPHPTAAWLLGSGLIGIVGSGPVNPGSNPGPSASKIKGYDIIS